MKSFLAAFAAVVFVCGSAQAEIPAAGATAPDFELQGTDGKTHKLSELTKAHKAVVVAWYPRAFTGGCTKECKAMKAQGAELKKFDVVYFTASTDPLDKNKDFAKSLDIDSAKDYAILSDPDGSVATKFGIFNAERKAASRYTFIFGEGNKILHVFAKVNTDNHGSEVAAKLKELGIPEAK
jgi:peroxiredoxin Q/BCP